MCGRYASSSPRRDLLSTFEATETVGEELPPSYNIAPTQRVNVVLERPPRAEPDADPARQVNSTVKWGLVPSWAKDPKIGSRMINARSETITQKPAFKAAAARRRCILPADGYYEWMKGDDGKKTPLPDYGSGQWMRGCNSSKDDETISVAVGSASSLPPNRLTS